MLAGEWRRGVSVPRGSEILSWSFSSFAGFRKGMMLSLRRPAATARRITAISLPKLLLAVEAFIVPPDGVFSFSIWVRKPWQNSTVMSSKQHSPFGIVAEMLESIFPITVVGALVHRLAEVFDEALARPLEWSMKPKSWLMMDCMR